MSEELLNLVTKAEKIIESCETFDQVDVAIKFVTRVLINLREKLTNLEKLYYPSIHALLNKEIIDKTFEIEERYKINSQHSCHICMTEF